MTTTYDPFHPKYFDEPDLRVPHPRFRDRRFVLQPLAEVAGDWVDPVSGQSVQDLLQKLPAV